MWLRIDSGKVGKLPTTNTSTQHFCVATSPGILFKIWTSDKFPSDARRCWSRNHPSKSTFIGILKGLNDFFRVSQLPECVTQRLKHSKMLMWLWLNKCSNAIKLNKLFFKLTQLWSSYSWEGLRLFQESRVPAQGCGTAVPRCQCSAEVSPHPFPFSKHTFSSRLLANLKAAAHGISGDPTCNVL